MAYEFVDVQSNGRVTVVTLNRPEVMNALHYAAHFELHDVFDAFATDPEQWVAIATGAGDRTFSVGNDLKWQAAGGKRGWNTSSFAGLTVRLQQAADRRRERRRYGWRLRDALACDLIIASENAVFALPEPRVGLAALAGGCTVCHA